jgi:hypothetical protein
MKLIELLSRKADAREAAGLGPVPRDEVDEMVEKLAQERLVALRAEHGIPAA